MSDMGDRAAAWARLWQGGSGILLRQCRHVTVVTNEVFSSGEAYQGDTLSYLRGPGVGQIGPLAHRADRNWN